MSTITTKKNNAFNTCLEILNQRNCNIVNDDINKLRIIAIKPNGNKIGVIFNNSSKFDTKSVKDTMIIMSEMKIKHSIVVYEDSITSAVKNSLNQLTDIKIELFSEEDLQYNITKHRLQPLFEKVPLKESEIFKKKYGTKFGTLKYDKPISRFYDYEKGDLIRITRKNNYITYRIVR